MKFENSLILEWVGAPKNWPGDDFLKLDYSHKKRKNSLATRGERAVLRAYVENQAILEPILLYRASKYKQTK